MGSLPALIALLISSSLPPIALTVSPRVSMRGDVRVETRIVRHPDNAQLELVIDGPIYEYSARTLNGEREPVVHEHMVRHPATGEYEVTAVLHRYDGSKRDRFTARDRFLVGTVGDHPR